MLQQTRVKTVIPYFKKFIKKYPDINTLSKASLDELLYIWSGLGYYKRIENIYKSIIIINKKYNGQFPTDYTNLIKLPGIGKSTAGAILSFSFNYHFPILDANIKRILIRVYKIQKIKNNINTLWKIIENLIPIHNTGSFNQAMMDIGSTICTNSKPKCKSCPVKKFCLSFRKIKDNTPKIKIIKKKKKYIYFLIIKKKKNFFLIKNTKKGIWKNLFIFPIFKNRKSLFNWIKKKKLIWKNIINIKLLNIKLSNKKFKIFSLIINIFSKKILKENKIKIWYRISKPKKKSIPSTIKKILNMIL